MLPRVTIAQGGDAVWGNTSFAPDDLSESHLTHGEIVAFRDHVVRAASESGEQETLKNMTSSSASEWILARTPRHFQVGCMIAGGHGKL